jgi:sirohydrochlorin cobaltochelatase
MKAIVLFAHGSRDPLWRLPVEAVAARLRAQHPDVPVRCAYLELTVPDLPSAVGELVSLGASQLTIVPMFLGTGRHAREDLPALVESLRQAHPAVTFALQQAVGEDPRVIELLAKIAVE